MADKEIGDLTAASALDGTETVHVVQGGNSRRTTTQGIADLGGGAASLDSLSDVDVSAVIDSDVLTYNASNQQWIPASPANVGWILHGSWMHSSDIPSVSFADLSIYSEIYIVAKDIDKSISGVTSLILSTDNGINFYNTSGDYSSIGTSGVAGNLSQFDMHISNTLAIRSSIAAIRQSNLSGVPKVIEGINLANAAIFNASTEPVNAIRLIPSAGGDFTAGSIYVFGRQ